MAVRDVAGLRRGGRHRDALHEHRVNGKFGYALKREGQKRAASLFKTRKSEGRKVTWKTAVAIAEAEFSEAGHPISLNAKATARFSRAPHGMRLAGRPPCRVNGNAHRVK